MRAYCQNCVTTQSAEWRPGQEPDGTQYEDLCCTQCDYIIASVEDRKAEQEERYDCPIHGKQDGPDCARC